MAKPIAEDFMGRFRMLVERVSRLERLARPPLRARGTHTTTVSIAHGAIYNIRVYYTDVFSSPPWVGANATSGRATVAVIEMNLNDALIQVNNWSGGAMAAGININWVAIGD